MKIEHQIVETPVGPLLLVANQRGLMRVAFECENFDAVLEAHVDNTDTAAVQNTTDTADVLNTTKAQLDDFFAGRRKMFDIALEWPGGTGFHRSVQRYLPQIGYGETMSYKQIAEQLGNPRAIRAVGTACACNPLPVIVPCHRVLRSDGQLGGYRGGVDVKTALLELEQGKRGWSRLGWTKEG